jgi:IrrE N-terminal-like domain
LSTVDQAPRIDRVAVATAKAREILTVMNISMIGEINTTIIAKSLGADVRYTSTGLADARTWRAGPFAWIAVDERTRGTPRARWSIAHELGHFVLDDDHDAVERIHAKGPKSGREHQIERAADAFAAALLMPPSLFLPYCGEPRPTFRWIQRVAWLFGTSLQATAKRYASLTPAPCAVLVCKDGVIRRATRSTTFRGVAVNGRPLEEGTFAAVLSGGGVVPRGPRLARKSTWGTEKLKVEMLEQAVGIRETSEVLVWLWHAPQG